ncbi:hypothetical protein LTR10_006957 [Elasticomyces elasticus]|nr:hypothetical protein LTR10_006957 [Elasticomyces elasticus]KAK4972643.1 hypothetical protein LTR42_005936 [Elasticomyces elasticus]
MSDLQYYAYDGAGNRLPPNKDRVECSGQERGWDPSSMEISDDVDAQISQAFSNVDLALRDAGVKDDFKQVFSIKSYHVGPMDETVFASMKKNMAHWLPSHKPIWTQLGVAALGLPAMKVEIDIVAIDGLRE